MLHPPALKMSLKRGACLAAANWPLVAVQFIAEGTLNLLLGVPVIGGIFLVVLVLGADVDEVMSGGVQQIIGAVVSALRANPSALGAFAAAFLVVLIGGSVLTFIVKAGTVAILAEAESRAGPIERPPLRLAALRRANLTNIEPFLAGCRAFWRRYVKLGMCLLGVYAVTIYAGFFLGGHAMAGGAGILGWTILALLGLGPFAVWLTLINFFYLLTQMTIVVEDVGVRAAVARVIEFLKNSTREVAGIFGVVLLFVAIATVASILATAGLGLIAFVPFVGLAIVPMQVAAWLLRGIVFEFIGLSALGAYLTQYRYYLHAHATVRVQETSSDVAGPGIA
jgi:hypothetical protein